MEFLYLARVESPLLISSRYTKTGPEPVIERIPGSSLAGALVRLLHRSFGVDIEYMSRLALKGDFVVGDAYPVKPEDGALKPSMPAPPFCVKIKAYKLVGLEAPIICLAGEVAKATPSDYSSVFLRSLRALNEYLLEHGVSYAGLVKPVLSTPVIHVGRRSIGGVNVLLMHPVESILESRIEVRDAVAIDPLTRRAEEGMLFSYDALAPGRESLWWGVAWLPEDIAKKLEDTPLEVMVGRGRSRGFGRVRVVFRRVEINEGDSPWYMLWTPLPASRLIEAYTPVEKSVMVVTGWSQSLDKPRASVSALKPGVLVWLKEQPPKPRARGLEPPWGQAERLNTQHLLPPSLVAAEKFLPKLMDALGGVRG